MKYDGYMAKYEEKEEPNFKPEKKETSKSHFKKSECGQIEINAEKVFITINCKEEKKEY